MDGSSINNGDYIFTHLNNPGLSGITSFPSFDSTSSAPATSSALLDHEQSIGLNIGMFAEDQNMDSSSPPTLSSSLPTSFAHSSTGLFGCSQSFRANNNNANNSSPGLHSFEACFSSSFMDTATSSSAPAQFNFAASGMMPYYPAIRDKKSRSASISNSMSFIDPAALMLNQVTAASSSSAQSTPETKAFPNFEEEEQHKVLRSLFEDRFHVVSNAPSPLISSRPSPSFTPNDSPEPEVKSNMVTASSSAGAVALQAAQSAYFQDIVLPDGTIYRFDGTDLVICNSLSSQVMEYQQQALQQQQMAASLPYMPFMDSATTMNQSHFALMTAPLTYPDYALSSGELGGFSSGSEAPSPRLGPLTRASKSAPNLRKAISAAKAMSKKYLSKSNSSSPANSRPSSAASFYSVTSSAASSTTSLASTPTLKSTMSSLSDPTTATGKYRKDGTGVSKCPFEGCNYYYNLKRELNRHRNVHVFAGKDKYRCMNCNSGLCRLDSVKRHMEAKGKSECLKRGLYQEFRENGELFRVRKCKPNWYEAAALANGTLV